MEKTSRKSKPRAKGERLQDAAKLTGVSRVSFLFDLDGTLLDSVFNGSQLCPHSNRAMKRRSNMVRLGDV